MAEFFRSHPFEFKDYIKNDDLIGIHVMRIQASKNIPIVKYNSNQIKHSRSDNRQIKFDFT